MGGKGRIGWMEGAGVGGGWGGLNRLGRMSWDKGVNRIGGKR